MFSVASLLLVVVLAQFATALPIEAAADMDRDSDSDAASDIKSVCPLHSAHHKGMLYNVRPLSQFVIDVKWHPGRSRSRSSLYHHTTVHL